MSPFLKASQSPRLHKSIMSDFPTDKVILNGGCYCSAVRYQINIPPYQGRPFPSTKEEDTDSGQTRFPFITFDHCNDCRKATGTIVPSWIMCPQSWVKWSVPMSKSEFPVPKGCLEGADVNAGERVEMTTEDYIKRPSALDGFVTAFNSSPETWRTFCTRCGSNLSYVCLKDMGKDRVSQIDINCGSLDRDSLEMPGVRPNAHFYCRYGIDWVQKVLWEGDSTVRGKALPKYPETSRLKDDL